MESNNKTKKNTVWIVLTCILTLTTVVLAIVLYRMHNTVESLQIQLAGAQAEVTSAKTNMEQQPAGADNVQPVRVMNGMLQQQDENKQWVDVASVEELLQADPVLAGRNKMQELITQNREAVQNGTATAEQLSPLMAKQSILAGMSLASVSQVQSGNNKTAAQTAKTQQSSNGTSSAVTPTAPPVSVQQPVSNDNSDNDNSDNDSSDNENSDGGNAGSSDSGNSDSGNSGESDNGSGGDSSDSGDGEDIGWTDEIL